MGDADKTPVKSYQPTMCSVCAWRKDCKKKYSYSQGSCIKCSDFTRDVSIPPTEKESA